MRGHNVILLASCVASVASSSAVAATLVVEVSNGTAGGSSVVGDAIGLQLFRQQELQEVREATVDETGRAVFEDLNAGPSITAVAMVKHQNMTFRSRPVSLTSPDGDYAVPVQVFDVSSDTSQLFVGTHHIILSVSEASLEITEYIQLRNDSGMAIRGSKRDSQGRSAVIEVSLPRGARDLTPLSYFERSALVGTETGFYDTMAVPPGQHHVKFSYRLDLARRTMDIDKEISLPTSELVVFWEMGQGVLEGLGEPDERLTNAQGVPIECYRRHDLQAGDRIAFQISGAGGKASDRTTWIVLAVVFAVIVILALRRLQGGAKEPVPVD